MSPIKVGLVGGGAIARAHAIGFKNVPIFFGEEPGFELYKLAEANDSLAQAAAKKYGFSKWTSDWRTVTNDPNVALVDVATPTFLHKDPAIEALEHGKSVICEKPLSSNVADAREMYDTAKRNGSITMVGFNYRRIPLISFSRDMIRSGRLGKIFQIRTHFLQDWAMQNFPLTWRFSSQKAGAGALADLGSHAIDLIRYLVGEPIEVCAQTLTFIESRPLPDEKDLQGKSDVDDTTFVLLRLGGGIAAQVDSSWVASGRKLQMGFEVNGSEGSISFDMERPNELQYYSSRDSETEQGFKTIYGGQHHPYGNALVFGVPSIGMGYLDSLTNQMRDLMVGVTKSEQVEPSFYDGWRVNQIMDAILKSALTKRWVSVE
ncbi:MAG: Gfo/Idh/MocA family oxidoreductase [Thaumarchaeota archaeon]|nr:Gfo/Idh/MocA family oxidoreductase [Nitrososphaerota archaeon]